jgi:hypothetical protein
MLGAFVGARRSLLVTQLAEVSGVQLVKSDDVLGGRRLLVDALDRSKRLPRVSDSETCDPRDVVVESHDTSRIPGLGFG